MHSKWSRYRVTNLPRRVQPGAAKFETTCRTALHSQSRAFETYRPTESEQLPDVDQSKVNRYAKQNGAASESPPGRGSVGCVASDLPVATCALIRRRHAVLCTDTDA